MASLVDLAGMACAPHGAPITVSASGKYAKCSSGCDTDTLMAYATSLNGHQKRSAPEGESEAHTVKGSSHQQNGRVHLNGQVRRPTLEQWRAVVFHTAQRLLNHPEGEYQQKALPAPMMLEPLMRDLKDGLGILRVQGHLEPQELSATDVDEECERLARMAIEEWAGGIDLDKALPAEPEPARSSIICEGQEDAVAANAEYLARPEVIERLGYSQSIALMIGGKHHGKTTNIRTLALSVPRGLDIWGRKTTQGPVLYVASDDEVASTRNELLQMGWDAKRDALKFARIDPESDADPTSILMDIAEAATKSGAILIILDMLFDFAAIRDEMSYAGTRQAIGMIQRLADWTKALVIRSHHTPKYLTDAHNAANAALGSQGISARFSPIILTRKYTEGLFTVESTSTRDPRGAAIKPMKIVKNEFGWIEAQGEFKEWMKWEIYAERVMEIFEGGDMSQGHSVFEVAEKLEIDRARVQNTLFQLQQAGRLKREKRGRTWKYFLPNSDLFASDGLAS